MAVEVDIDVGVLKREIRKTYASVSQESERDVTFPAGHAWAEDLRHPAEEPARVPEAAVASFAGVANPFSLVRSRRASMCSTSVPVLVSRSFASPMRASTS